MNALRAALILSAAFALSGCIAAAVVPFAAAGVIGKTQRDRAKGRGETAVAVVTPMPSGRSGQRAGSTPTPSAAPVAMRALSVPEPTPVANGSAASGQATVLTTMTRLPPPSAAPSPDAARPIETAAYSARPLPPTTPPAPEPAPGVTILPMTALPPPTGAGPVDARPAVAPGDAWRALLRHVAASLVERPGEDAFGAPGCDKRQPAVAIDAGVAEENALEREVAFRVLDSLRTLEVAVIFVGADDAGPALARAGFGEVAQGLTLVRPTQAAGLSRRYCVLAIGSTQRDAAMLAQAREPRWGSGWYLLAGAADEMTSLEEGPID